MRWTGCEDVDGGKRASEAYVCVGWVAKIQMCGRCILPRDSTLLRRQTQHSIAHPPPSLHHSLPLSPPHSHPSRPQHSAPIMSDREGFAGDDEHTLPKATVYKLIGGEYLHLVPWSWPRVAACVCQGRETLRLCSFSRLHLPWPIACPNIHRRGTQLTTPAEMLPDDISCAKDTKEIIVDCCVGASTLLTRGRTRR